MGNKIILIMLTLCVTATISRKPLTVYRVSRFLREAASLNHIDGTVKLFFRMAIKTIVSDVPKKPAAGNRRIYSETN